MLFFPLLQAKTVYCVNCVFYFIRLLGFYKASRSLGPKLVMINRMVRSAGFSLARSESFTFLSQKVLVCVRESVTTRPSKRSPSPTRHHNFAHGMAMQSFADFNSTVTSLHF